MTDHERAAYDKLVKKLEEENIRLKHEINTVLQPIPGELDTIDVLKRALTTEKHQHETARKDFKQEVDSQRKYFLDALAAEKERAKKLIKCLFSCRKGFEAFLSNNENCGCENEIDFTCGYHKDLQGIEDSLIAYCQSEKEGS